MKARPILSFLLFLLLVAANLMASGMVGIYGIIEKVVFEPNEQAPERLQVWGVFAYGDGGSDGSMTSDVQRGYFYFKIQDPNSNTNKENPAATRTEWRDLKAVAGTGQAVAFGRWIYIGSFDSLMPDVRSGKAPYILETVPRGGGSIDMRVRPATEKPVNPAAYQTDAGIVKLSALGNLLDLVKKTASRTAVGGLAFQAGA